MQSNNNSIPGDSNDSLGYSDAESYLQNGPGDDGGSLATAQNLNNPHYQTHHRGHHPGGPGEENDATSVVHEMHLALLYLLSNPDEFQRALAARPSRGATTLHEWNAEYEDNESLADTQVTDAYSTTMDAQQRRNRSGSGDDDDLPNGGVSATPLPFVVFADDAEVVLPAAFSASQLFGLEKISGMELEAAAGLPALSQLFLRWLALMPGGDHLNLIDPPGLTVMRIAGGRYRVTAAHRVVWTWMNEFPNDIMGIETDALSGAAYSSSYYSHQQHHDAYSGDGDLDSQSTPKHNRSSYANGAGKEEQLLPGDLVTLTIVDVFETDNQGKLLSYCPTFDNRAVTKTNAPTETLRKSTAHLVKLIGKAQKSVLARKISFHATQIAMSLKERVEEAVSNNKNLSPLAGAAGFKTLASPSTVSTSPVQTKKKTITTTPSRRKGGEEKKQEDDAGLASPPRRSVKEVLPSHGTPSGKRQPFPTDDLESHDI
eukprot:CAMPEP_0172449840 /NCGR_PEP_ID=MMETSP1065-20121228/8438_1 /TAXON_ID=265537 /ORGANISM="Amphiprora paludosa, Strain CCMP125" /LENGTH=485 /DNA_ID=CAMNT_0013201593 /DNA_START=60 /DNA_END=1517 /DNA_ORIENTATION=-